MKEGQFPRGPFFFNKLLFLKVKKGLGLGTAKQLIELKKKMSKFFVGSLSPSENTPLGEKALSGQMLLELNFSLLLPCLW